MWRGLLTVPPLRPKVSAPFFPCLLVPTEGRFTTQYASTAGLAHIEDVRSRCRRSLVKVGSQSFALRQPPQRPTPGEQRSRGGACVGRAQGISHACRARERDGAERESPWQDCGKARWHSHSWLCATGKDNRISTDRSACATVVQSNLTFFRSLLGNHGRRRKGKIAFRNGAGSEVSEAGKSRGKANERHAILQDLGANLVDRKCEVSLHFGPKQPQTPV